MHRRDFLANSSRAAAAGLFIDPARFLAMSRFQPPAPAAAPVAPPATAPTPWPAPFDSEPTLQAPTSNGVTIVVAVKAPCTAWVEYGPTEALGQRADDSRHGLLPLNDRVHSITLTGIAPGATCFYRVVAR